MELFVSRAHLPANCAVCPFHIGIDNCYLRLDRPGRYKNVTGGSDECPLMVLPHGCADLASSEVGSYAGVSETTVVDKVSGYSPKSVLIEHDFKPRLRSKRPARSWSLVLPMETSLDYNVRCPVCGTVVPLEQGLQDGLCSRCHAHLPTVEVQGMFCGVQFGSHVYLPVPVGESVLIMGYEIIGFRYDHSRNKNSRFLLKVKSCGFVDGYAPAGDFDLPVFSMTEFPLTAEQVRRSHYDVVRDVERGCLRWSYLYAFPELLHWSNECLDTSLHKLHSLLYLSERTYLALLEAHFVTPRDLLFCTKEDLLMVPGFDESCFLDLYRGLTLFAEDSWKV